MIGAKKGGRLFSLKRTMRTNDIKLGFELHHFWIGIIIQLVFNRSIQADKIFFRSQHEPSFIANFWIRSIGRRLRSFDFSLEGKKFYQGMYKPMMCWTWAIVWSTKLKDASYGSGFQYMSIDLISCGIVLRGFEFLEWQGSVRVPY